MIIDLVDGAFVSLVKLFFLNGSYAYLVGRPRREHWHQLTFPPTDSAYKRNPLATYKRIRPAIENDELAYGSLNRWNRALHSSYLVER